MKKILFFVIILYNFNFVLKNRKECLIKLFFDSKFIKRINSLPEKECFKENYNFDYVENIRLKYKNIIKPFNKIPKHHNNRRYYKNLLKNFKIYNNHTNTKINNKNFYMLDKIDLTKIKTNNNLDKEILYIRNERILESFNPSFYYNELKKIENKIINNLELFPTCYRKLIDICLNQDLKFKNRKIIIKKNKNKFDKVLKLKNKKCLIGKNVGLLCKKNEILKSINGNCPNFYSNLGLKYCVQHCPRNYLDVGEFCFKN